MILKILISVRHNVHVCKQSVHIYMNFHLQWFEQARAKCEAVGGDIPAVPR